MKYRVRIEAGAAVLARVLGLSVLGLGVLTLALHAGPLRAAPAAPAKEAPPPLGKPRDFTLPARSDVRLPNGLAMTFVPFGTVPKTTIMVVVRTGNIDDGRQTGLADIVTELMKEGAGERDAETVARLAADMGGALDVSAGPDQTTVALDVLSERASDAVALAADVLRRPRLPEAELPRLKANFARQIAVARSTPQAIAGEAYARALWGDHPYGRTLPSDADLASYTIDDIRRFVTGNFGAARTHVYVGGRFDREAVERAITAAFGDWAAGPRPTVNVPTGGRAHQVLLYDRPGAAQSTLLLGLPAADPSMPDYIRLTVANTLLGGSLMSRIDQNIREEKGWTYGARSSISPAYRAASWTLSTDVNTPDTAPALREIHAEIARLEREPPTVEELARVQNYRAGTFVIGASSRGGLLGQLAFLELHGLPDAWLTDYVRRIYAVTPAEVTAVTQRNLDPNAMTLVVVGDLAKIGKAVRALPALKGARFIQPETTRATGKQP